MSKHYENFLLGPEDKEAQILIDELFSEGASESLCDAIIAVYDEYGSTGLDILNGIRALLQTRDTVIRLRLKDEHEHSLRERFPNLQFRSKLLSPSITSVV